MWINVVVIVAADVVVYFSSKFLYDHLHTEEEGERDRKTESITSILQMWAI